MKLGLLIFFAANTLAAPFWVLDKDLPRAEVKVVGCKASRLSQGQDYSYDYEGETINRIDGASTQATGLKLRAQITITPMAECKFHMKISKTELLQKSMSQDVFVKSADSDNFKSALEKYDLVFSMSENQITKLFSNKEEPVYILNAKRGILSTIQLEESVSVESDVNGLCKTTIVREDGKIVKSKKLSDCSLRTIQEIGFHAATIKSDSDIKVLDSNSVCVYKMSGNVINSVSCEETHLFKPFSAGHKAPSGAITTVKQTLTNVQGAKASSIPLHIDGKMQESSILYDHTSEENQAIKSLKDEFEGTIQRLAKPNEVKQFTVKMDSAHEFSTMVFLLRKMDMKRMTIVWDKYFDCIESKVCDNSQVDLRDVYRQYLLDGIAYCGTSTCVTMVHDAIVKEAITGERMNIFLQSIALVATTSRKIIRDVMGIVAKQPTRQGYLTLGTILNRHCKKNIADCDDVKPNIITQAENFLIGKLGKDCEGQENNERVEEILMSLKALSNAQRPSRASSVILQCAANSEHVNITSAAFDAIGNMPCDKVIVDKLYNFVNETSNAPNKRIPAFIALMKCPNEVLLELVVDLLEKEPSNQLASFIWSYLTNIMESSNPKHESTKALLEKITKVKPLREFDMPFHQYSRAFEKSTYFQAIKSGAALESHIVFNHENYFPQSAFFDLTANVLGVPVSLLETNIGIEGMEDLLEQAAGDDGFLSKNNFVFNLFNFNITAQKLRDLAQQREPSVVRNRRAAGANEDNIAELHKKVNRKNKLPNGHLSFKVMGQEIRTFSYDDIFHMVDQIDNMNVIQLLLNVAKGGSKTFTKSMMFLEMTQTVPTGLGLPLKLKLVGTTVAGIELNGKFDIRNMFWGPGSLTINGFVKPSAAVEISGHMGVDGHFVSSGVFVNSSMFVSNTIKGAIVYQEGKLLKINMDVPEEPVELFKVGSTPFMYLNGKNEAIEGVERKIKPEETCFKSLLIGYGICTNIRMPVSFREYEAPYFPLSGPAHFGVKLFRADEKLQTFQFLVSMTKKQPVTSGVIEFSTPGALYERKIGGEFEFTDVDDTKTLTLSAQKSNKMASVEFSYNSVTCQTSLVGKNNIFTEKDIVTKFVFFNTSNTVNVNQIGLRFSTEYDWYKFESVGKLVKKETGFILTGSTLYYPTKSITGVLEYNSDEQKILTRVEVADKSFELTGNYQKKGNERGLTVVASSGNVVSTLYGGFLNEDNKQEVLFSVNGFGNVFKNSYTYEHSDGQQSFETKVLVNDRAAQLRSEVKFEGDATELVFTGDIVGRTAVSKFLFINTATIKEVNVTANIVGNYGQASLKYLADGPSFVSTFDVMGRKSNAFITIDNSVDYKLVVGGSAGGYTAGVRNVYSQTEDTESLCATLYYETMNLEKQAGIVCAKMSSFNKEFIQRTVALSLAVGEKNVEFAMDFKKQSSQVKLNTDFRFNSNLLFNNQVNIKYNQVMDSEASVSYKVLDYNTGFKLFSRKSNEELQFGFETKVMKTSVLLLQRYSTTGENKEMKSEIFINDKVIPVNAQMNYVKSAAEKKIILLLTGGQYSIQNFYNIFNNKNMYQLGSGVTVNKDDSTIFKVYETATIQCNDETKAFDFKFGAVLFKKTYEYGWETEFKNLGKSDKTSVLLVSRLQYATDRKSSISLTLSNSKLDASAVVEFEYIPSNILTYSVNINKALYQVDSSFEFLPKMFTKFMARLENKNGYQLITDGSIEWSGYKRSLGASYTYKHTDSELIVSSSIGKDLSLSITYTKSSPKSIELAVSAFKNNAKWIGILEYSNLQSQFIWNGKEVMNIGTNMELDVKSFFFQISKGKEALMKLSENINDVQKNVFLNLPDIRNLLSFDGKLEKDALSFKVFGKEEWISFNGEVDREKKTAFGIISVFNRAIKITGLLPTDGVSLIVNPSFMNEFSLNAIYNPQERSINLNAKTITRTVGFILRADTQNMIASIQTFCNENKISLDLFVENNSLITRLSITPKFTVQFVFEILNDNTLMFSTQTVNEGKALTLTSVKYQLSKGLSQLALNWNQETASMIYQTVSPIIESFRTKSAQNSKIFVNYVYESAMDGKVSATDFINMMDKAYSEIDIKLGQEKFRSVTELSIQRLSQMIKDVLKEIVRNIDSLKKQLPEVLQKLTNLKDQANIILRKISQSIIEINSDLENNLKEAVIIIYEAISNITRSTQPVIVKAFELVRGFKVQGMTVEEFVLSQTKTITYLTDYTMRTSSKFTVLISKLKEDYFSENILTFKVPYTDETIGKVLEIIVEKGLELKNLIVELTLKAKNQIDILNLQKSLEEMQTRIMSFKIENKSIEEHVVILKKNLNIELLLNDMQEVIQKLQSNSQLSVNKIVKFLTPLMDHIKFVNAAFVKHFKPIITKSANEVLHKLSAIQIPDIEKYLREQWIMIEKILLPMIEPIQPFYMTIRKHISNFELTSLESWLKMRREKFSDYAQEIVVKARINVDDQINMLKNSVEKIFKSTHEEMMRNIALSDIKKKDVIEYFTKKITEHEKIVYETIEKIKLLWNQLKSQYIELGSKPLKDVIDSLFSSSSVNILATVEELSKTLKTLSEMDLTENLTKALENANQFSQMTKLQMDSMIRDIVKQTKTINTTEIALKTIQMVQQFVADIYSLALVFTTNLNGNMDKVIPYLRTIPDLEYNKWFDELKIYALNYNNEVHLSGNKFYDFSKKTTDRLSNVYETNKVHLEMLYAQLPKIEAHQIYSANKVKIDTLYKQISQINYNQLYDENVVPLKQWCTELCREIKEKSKLVYKDVEEPSEKLYNYYKDLVTGFVMENYDTVVDQASIFYQALISEMNIALNKIKIQLKELTATLDETYQHFLTKYQDMTWEEISQIICNHGKTIAKETQTNAIKLYNNLLKLSNVWKVEVEKMYVMTTAHFNLYLTNIQSKVQPEVIKMYIQYKIFVGKRIVDVRRIINELAYLVRDQASDVKDQMVVVYNANKNKSLKKLYTEVAAITVTQFNKQYELFEKNIHDLKNRVIQTIELFVYDYYTKANVLLKTVIIPELVAESESFVNQTLRLSVILANETVNAYSPHFYVIKDIFGKFTEEMKTKVFDLSEEVSKKNSIVLEENLTKLQTLINNFYTKLQNNDVVMQAINHDYLKKSSIELKKLKETVELKINELKSNPTSIEYRLQAEQAFIKVQEYFEGLRKQKSEQVSINEIIAFMQNVRESGVFTLNKATQKLKPGYDAITIKTLATIDRIFVEIKKVAILFRQYPEETFWKTLNAAKENVRSSLQSIDLLEINMSYSRWLSEIQEDDYFNDWAKIALRKAIKYAQSTSESLEIKMKDLVSYTKNTVSSCKENVEIITNWYLNQISLIPEKWSKCPISSILANPLWSNLKNELMSHELFIVANIIAGKGQENVLDIKDTALTELENKKNELNGQIFDRYHQRKEKTLHQYKEFAQNYNHLVKKVDERYQKLVLQTQKTLEDTTVSDVISFIQTSTSDIIERISEVKKMLDDIQVVYITKGKELYNKYSNDFTTQFEDYKSNVIAMFNQCQLKVTTMFSQSHTELQLLFTQYKQTLVPYYEKLESTIKQYYQEYYPLVIENCKNVYSTVKLQLNGVSTKSEQILNQFIKDTLDMSNLVYSESYSQWMQSDLRVTLVSLPKMTIKETVSVLLRLPSQIKKMIITTYNKYQKDISVLSEQFPKIFSQMYNNFYNTCHHFCSNMYKSINESISVAHKKMTTAQNHYYNVCKNVLVQLNENKHDLIKFVKPYVDSFLTTGTWIKNEVTESTLFFYQYYHVEEKLKIYQDSVFSEYKHVIPTINDYKEVALKISKEYTIIAQKISQEYKDMALKYTTESREHANLFVQKYKEIVIKYFQKYYPVVEKFLGQYIELAQQYVKEYQPIALKYYDEIKEQAPKIALKYKDMAQQYVKEYQPMALKYYEEIKDQATKIVLKYKDMAQQYVKEYQAIALKLYEEIKEQAPKIALKYRDMAQQYVKEYQVIALKLYEEIKELAPKFALKYRDMAQQYVKEYQVIALKLYEEIKEQAPKIALKYRDMAQQFVKEYQPIVFKYYEEIEEQATKIALKYRDMAQQYVKEYQVIALKLYEEIKEQAPKIALKYRDMAQQYVKEFQPMALKYYEEIKEQAPKIALKYRDMAQQYVNKYQVVAEKFTLDYIELVQKLATEYKKLVIKYYGEFAEQAPKVVEKYRNSAKRYIQEYQDITETLVAEYKEDAQKFVLLYKETVVKLIKEYHPIVEQFIADSKNTVIEFARKYILIAQKVIDESRKYIDNFDLKNIKNDFESVLDNYLTELKKNVVVESKNGEMYINVYHREITPKFSHHLTSIGVRSRRSIDSIKLKGSDMVLMIEKQLEELKTKVRQLITKIQLFMADSTEVKAVLLDSYYSNKKILETSIENGMQQFNIVYKNALNEFEAFKIKASKFMNDFSVAYYIKESQDISLKYYAKAQTQSLEYYEQAKQLYSTYLSEGQKLFSNYFVIVEKQFLQYYAQVQEFSLKYYNEVEKMYPEYYNQAKEMSLKYYAQVKDLSLKYYNHVEKMYPEYCNQVKDLSLKYYTQVKDLSLKYYNQVEKMYPEYYNQAKEMSLKYYTQVKDFSLKYYNQVEKMYPEYYNQAKELSLKYYTQVKDFSLKYYNQVEKMYSEYYNQAKEFTLKYYNQAEKFYLDYHNQMKELSLKYFTQVQEFSIMYTGRAEKLYLEYYNQGKELSLKYYNQAEKLYPEYYDQAKELSLKYYTQAQEFSLNYFNQAQKLYSDYNNQAQEFSLKYYNQAQKLYPEYFSKAKEFCLEYYIQSQKFYTEYQSQAQKLYSDYYDQVQKLSSVSYDQVNKISLEYFKQAQELSLKYYNQALNLATKYKNEVQQFYNKKMDDAQTLYGSYYNQVQTLSSEYVSLTEKFYSESQKLTMENYEQAQVIYSNYKNQVQMLFMEVYKQAQIWSLSFYEKSNVELKNLLIQVSTLYSDFKKDPSVFFKVVYQKSVESFNLWKSKAEKLYDQYQPKIVSMLKDHQTLLMAEAKSLSRQITLIYNKLQSKLNNWKSKATLENLSVVFEKVNTILKETPLLWRDSALQMYQQYQPQIASMLNQQQRLLTTKVESLLKQMKITYSELTTAFDNWKSGVSAEKAFYQYIRRVKYLTKYASFETLEKIRQALCINHIEACQRFTDSIQLQVTFVKNYINGIVKLVISKEVAVLQYVRNEFSVINDQKKSLMSSLATAMIFGNNHVITFDKKVYDFVDYNQRDCTYLLARDFVNGKFSIMRQMDTTIIDTPEMSIKIKNDGKTQATIGNKTINSLPVESGSSRCVRMFDVIRCDFIEQGVFVTVDLVNVVTTIRLSSWHFGKTQGVLGTYNHEAYDDWKMPDSKIADNIHTFANAYEITKKRSCVATPKEKMCSSAPSAKCKEIFESTSSMFVRYFKVVDPKPFLDACEDDTSCKSIGHCSSVTAYRSLLSAMGEKPDFCQDCVAFDSHKINEEWNLKPTGSVDVVMLVSDRVSGKDFKKQLMKIMIQVQQFLRVNKYDTRYALIGFGGKGVHESSHIRPIGTGEIFGSSDDLLKEMKKMEFNGENDLFNDAFEAITMGSKLSFRPGASRIFILYTEDDVKSSLAGVTQIEAQHFLEKEANASLIVFQNLQTKDLAQQLKGNFIGETANRIYSDKAPTGSQKGSQSLTTSTFKKLTDSSNGALFTTDFTSVNIVSKSLYDVMSLNIQRVNSQCQQCVVQAKENGDPIVICATRNDITC